MEYKLKPCPFCGKKPILRNNGIRACSNRQNGDLITTWEVYCPQCGTKKEGGCTEYYFTNDETLVIRDNLFDGRKKAVEAWNRRAKND